MSNRDEFIAKRVRTLRKRNYLNQTEMARYLDTTKPIIALIESNKTQCSEELLDRICERFKISRVGLMKNVHRTNHNDTQKRFKLMVAKLPALQHNANTNILLAVSDDAEI